MGLPSPAGTNDAAAMRVEVDVMSLYLDDYVDHWVKLLGDLAIVRGETLAQTTEILNILSGPGSPIKSLLADVARETTLTPSPAQGQQAAQEQLQKEAGRQAAQALNSIGQVPGVLGKTLLRLNEGGPGAQAPEKRVEERFVSLHEFVAGSP